MQQRQSTKLRELLASKTFLHMPAVYDALTGRLVQSLGYEATYVGGYVTGGASTVTEPQLTMTEQVRLAEDVASKIDIPLIVDAGAGFGEPLHTMRTVKEFIRAGVAGVHIEDALFPKRAHYHTYVVHGIPTEEFVEKIQYAVKQRDISDPDFVIIARSDTCRAMGLDEAVNRVNAAAEVGADLGLLFPRHQKDAEEAPKRCKLPLVYVQSRGNRDGRPIYTAQQLKDMGYVACIEAQVVICSNFHYQKKLLTELRTTGDVSGMSKAEWVAARQEIENLIDLEEHYEIERQTVESRQAKD
ncbi:MAG: isocitrate lyase/PEP mutase family protein [Oxalobacteraceae bacterium]|nr:MAG: isocitrate lyase/PEP mutase family protein [Oxalobacteraceae bacterium]